MYRDRGGNGMEFRYRAVDEQSAPYPPPPSTYTYFTEQAIRAGYMGPGLGRMQENFQNPVLDREAIQRATSDCISAGYFGPGLGRMQENFQNPVLTREAIQRELEKERIREEIIAADTRRRVLEDEVRREMMLERELAYLGRGNGFDSVSFLPGAGMTFAGPGMIFYPRDLSFRRAEGRSVEDRIAMSHEEKLGNASRHEIGGREIVPYQERIMEHKIAGHEMIPFQQRAVEPKIAEVPYPEVTKEKEKIVFMAKPETNLSGHKRKSVTPPEEDTSELPLIVVAKKKVKEEWSCAICQVTATSECGLNEHLQGRKHKSKEAALVAKRNGKNFGIGIGTQNVAKYKKLKETANNSGSEQGGKPMVQLLQSNQTVKSSLQIIPITKSLKANELPVLKVIPKADLSKNEVLGTDAKKKLAKKKKKKFQFWCQMCRVGAHSENVMEAHRKGKKHKTALEEDMKNKAIAAPQMDSTEIVDANKPTEDVGNETSQNEMQKV